MATQRAKWMDDTRQRPVVEDVRGEVVDQPQHGEHGQEPEATRLGHADGRERVLDEVVFAVGELASRSRLGGRAGRARHAARAGAAARPTGVPGPATAARRAAPARPADLVELGPDPERGPGPRAGCSAQRRSGRPATNWRTPAWILTGRCRATRSACRPGTPRRPGGAGVRRGPGRRSADRVDVDDVGLDSPRPQPGHPRPGRCGLVTSPRSGRRRRRGGLLRSGPGRPGVARRRIDVAHVEEAGQDRGPGAVWGPASTSSRRKPGECVGPSRSTGCPIRGGIGHGGQQALQVAGLARPNPGTVREGHLVRPGLRRWWEGEAELEQLAAAYEHLAR